MKQLRFYSALSVGVSPLHRGGSFVIMTDVAHEFRAEIGQGAKDPASDDMSLDFGKPVLYLIQPRRIGRRVVNPDVAVSLKEGFDQLCLMGRKVVGNNMDLLANGLRVNNLSQKAHKLSTGMAFGGLAKDFSAAGFHGRIERKGAVTKILKPMRFGSARRQWQDRIKAVQRLNGAFFIDAEDGCMSRRMQIETDNVCRLGFKIGVIADHVVAKTMRLKPVAAPHSCPRHVAGPQLLGQAPAAPLSGAIIGSPSCPLQDTCFQFGGVFADGPPLMAAHQSRDAAFQKAVPPTLDVGSAASHAGRDRPNARSRGQLQDRVRPLGIFSSDASRSNPSVQLSTFRWTNHNAFAFHSSNIASYVADIKVTLH